MNDKTDTTILLDIYERLGTMEEQLRSLIKSHDAQEEKIEELEQFKARVGAYLWIGGALVSGVLWLLWQGLTYWSVEIKAFFFRLTH